ncbi:MAG: hypothetical protein N2234_08850, partial [Planctomycetota bacterium]|nr:hypothetical protein [Planctomycetota bacterium]
FGERCWYEEGAKAILASQMEDGSWDRELVDTSFAILFLSRAVVAPADDTIYTGEGLLPGNKGK